MHDWLEILNLLYSYNDRIDRGDFEGAVDLFKDAQLRIAGKETVVSHTAYLALLKQVIIIYPDGILGTRHLLTNPIIETAPNGQTAVSKATFTVLQQTPDPPLQVIASGYYNDQFEKYKGRWRFKLRESIIPNLYGNVTRHIDFAALANF